MGILENGSDLEEMKSILWGVKAINIGGLSPSRRQKGRGGISKG